MNNNSKNKKNRVVFSDKSCSNISYRGIGMNISNQNKIADKTKEDSNYDSGILSDANLTSAEQFLSEEIAVDTPKPKSDEPTNDRNSKLDEKVMGPDSGIDIGVTESSLSIVENSSTDLFSSTSISGSKSKSELLKEKSCEQQKSPNPYPWQLHFQQDDEGNTQLHIAILDGYTSVIPPLLRLIPNSSYLDIQNDYCQTALHLSVLMNQPSTVRKLLISGARTDIVDEFGNTALHLACEVNSLECIKALLDPIIHCEYTQNILQYTSEIDFPYVYIDQYNYSGLAAVHIAARKNKNLKILHELLLHAADINIRECRAGHTILHEATLSGNEELIRYILTHTCINLEVKTYSRLTAYQLSEQCPNISKILLDKGAVKLPFPEDEEDSDDDEDEDDENNGNNIMQSNFSNIIISRSANFQVAVTS